MSDMSTDRRESAGLRRASLCRKSVALEIVGFSPVGALPDLHPSDPMQRVRNAFARNPYTPRGSGDPFAYSKKRRHILVRQR
jgi:hypothetical protein